MASRISSTLPNVGIIVPAAGRGERLGSSVPKPLVKIGGVPLVVYTLKILFRAYPFAQVLVPVEPEAVASMRRLLTKHGLQKAQVLAGGAMRAESVKNGFDLLKDEIDIVAVHDLARPFISAENICQLVAAAQKHGAALLAQKAVATVKESDAAGSVVRRTLDRNRIFLAQTPQVFRTSLLRKAYAAVGPRFSAFTDEAALAEAAGSRIHIVAGPAMNFKITTPDDLKLARLVAESNKRKQ